MKLIFTHLGLKHTNTFTDTDQYIIPKADFYIDCRCLKERCTTPQKEIEKCMKDPSEENFSREFNRWGLQTMQEQILCMLQTIPTRRRGIINPYAKPITIVFMCARGCNRSPVAKFILGKRFENDREVMDSVKLITKEENYEVDIQ